jgi:segregation and condensation protein A
MTFRALVADAENTLVIVARFLALLELYREGVLRFEQVVALGELQIMWIGSESGEIVVSDEFDQAVVVPDESEQRKELDSENKNDDEQKGL